MSSKEDALNCDRAPPPSDGDGSRRLPCDAETSSRGPAPASPRPAPGLGDGAASEARQVSLAEWKNEQIKKKAESTRERLRQAYAKQAALIKLGDRCQIGGHRGIVAFLGDEVEGLPGGFWVGIRYDEPVGKNDGTVKGVRLFHCSPNCGHLVRPDKVLEGAISSHTQAAAPPTAREHSTMTPPARGHGAARASACSSSDEDDPVRPISWAPASSPKAGEDMDQEDSLLLRMQRAMPRARSISPTRSPVLVTKRGDPGNTRYEKWRNIDPATVIGTDPELDETAPRQRTGLVYDTRMEAHRSQGAFHPEQPLRINAIFAALAEQGLAQRCWRVPARPATQSELETVHTAQHVQDMCNLSSKSQGDLNDMAANLDSVYLCPESSDAALLASGSVIEATRLVCQGKLGRATCVVRPPGHHALPSCAMGFCLFGNVAVAAAEARKREWAQRVLIFDWDVHHGNGTQKMFWQDPTVLVFSVHRHENGNFYPGGAEGHHTRVGEFAGRGYNVNVPWPKPGAGDHEYKVVIDELLKPIASEYRPDLVLISAGFDAAQGDPLGGCHVTPAGYYMMTKACKEFAGGKVVIALEGGYSLRATSQSMAACVSALLDPSQDPHPTTTQGTLTLTPAKPATAAPADVAQPARTEDSNMDASPSALSAGNATDKRQAFLDTIEEVRKVQALFWRSVRKLDDNLHEPSFLHSPPLANTSRTRTPTSGPTSSNSSHICTPSSRTPSTSPSP